VAGHAKVRQGAARVSTIVFGATSISINSVPMSSSGSVKLRYEKCLQVWGNASSAASQDKPFMHPTAFDDGHQALDQKPWRHNSSTISDLDTISRVGKAKK
jgi:hypothetical protein